MPESIWAPAVPAQCGADNGNPAKATKARSTVAVLFRELRFRMFEALVVNVPRRDRNELPFVVALERRPPTWLRPCPSDVALFLFPLPTYASQEMRSVLTAPLCSKISAPR